MLVVMLDGRAHSFSSLTLRLRIHAFCISSAFISSLLNRKSKWGWPCMILHLYKIVSLSGKSCKSRMKVMINFAQLQERLGSISVFVLVLHPNCQI